MSHKIVPRASRRILLTATVLCAAGLLLAACATPNSDSAAVEGNSPTPVATTVAPTVEQSVEISDSYQGSPADDGGRLNLVADTVIFDPHEPDALTLVLNGSSTCPVQPSSYTTNEEGIVDFRAGPVGADQDCSENSVLTTSVIVTPATFDPDKGVTINGGTVEVSVQD
jgi:hypothetical protein